MANLITNKHKKLEYAKKPGGYLKRLSARKLRRAAAREVAAVRIQPKRRRTKHALRKQPGRCPVCLGRLSRNARGTRHHRSCNLCTAQVAPEIRCHRCGTYRVWQGVHERRCKGCGHVVT